MKYIVKISGHFGVFPRKKRTSFGLYGVLIWEIELQIHPRDLRGKCPNPWTWFFSNCHRVSKGYKGSRTSGGDTHLVEAVYRQALLPARRWDVEAMPGNFERWWIYQHTGRLGLSVSRCYEVPSRSIERERMRGIALGAGFIKQGWIYDDRGM